MLALNITRLDLEAHHSCAYDSLAVESPTGELLARFCGPLSDYWGTFLIVLLLFACLFRFSKFYRTYKVQT